MVRGEEDCAVKVELVQCFRCRLDGKFSLRCCGLVSIYLVGPVFQREAGLDCWSFFFLFLINLVRWHLIS